MGLDLKTEKGVPLERQVFTWKEMTEATYSKLNDDAFSRVRVILMNGLEAEAVRFSHACARMNKELQPHLARIRRVEQHQRTLVNWLNPSDQSALENTIALEQTAIEVTAAVAQSEPDPYLASVYRFGMLEDFDHMYRYAALMDRVEGKDANNILQSYTDIRPGRPTCFEHRDPLDDLRDNYNRKLTEPISKINALTIMAAETQTHDYYMTVGPMFSDPMARQLYAEIASIEEQHVTQYESIIDPQETWIEKWLLHELAEVYNYWSCVEQEGNPQLKQRWQRGLDYELGHLHYVMDLMRRLEKRDPYELLPTTLPAPIPFASQRQFVRDVLENEVDLRAKGAHFISKHDEGPADASVRYRQALNQHGSPSETVAANYIYRPGTELSRGKRSAA